MEADEKAKLTRKEKVTMYGITILVVVVVVVALVGLLAFANWETSAVTPTYQGTLVSDILGQSSYTFYLKNVTVLFSQLNVNATKSEQVVTCNLSEPAGLFWFMQLPAVSTPARFNATSLTVGSQVIIQQNCQTIEES